MQEFDEHNATYADLEAVPEDRHLVAELVNGRLVTHPRPTGRHGRVHTRLISVLGQPFMESLGGTGGWEIITEPELHFGRNVTVPEIAGWRIERFDQDASPHPLDPVKITLVPDWVCEILSPSTEGYDRDEKQDIYGGAGVNYLWVVAPVAQALETYELVAGEWVHRQTYSGDIDVRIPPFDALEFRFSRIWPWSRIAPTAV